MQKSSLLFMLLCLLMATVVILTCFNASTGTFAQGDGIALPIIMYHSIDKKVFGDYIISPQLLESDLQWLKEHGFNTVVVGDLIKYVDGGCLPENPVMLTFDDGYYNNYLYALPMLEKYDCRAVISVVGSFSENADNDKNSAYSMLSVNDIKALGQSGHFEIQNHSYGFHSMGRRSGAKKRNDESVSLYENIFTLDTQRMQRFLEEQCNIKSTAYTYPFGQICAESEAALKRMGFKASLSCESRINRLSRNSECLFGLGRFNRTSKTKTADFMRKFIK